MLLKGRSAIIISIAVFAVFVIISNIFLAVLASAISYAFPVYLGHRKKKALIEKFREQLIDGIELISGALVSGMTFQQGLVYVIKETKDPLSGELKSVMDKIMLGVSTEKALFELAETHDLKELHLFSSALEITRDAGGNLSEVLKNIAKGMREKESSEKQIETLTAQSKLSGLIVGLLPVILLTLMYYMDKELVLPMFTTSLGLLLVLIAVCLELLGAVFIIKIINFNY